MQLRSHTKAQRLRKVFPIEVMYEILTYIPLDYLARDMQLVCKDWRAIIHERYFLEKQRDRTQTYHHWHIGPTYQGSRSDDGIDRISYLTGLDGLVLMRNTTKSTIFIWNPATRLVLDLPNPPHDHSYNYGYSLSYLPASKKYKITSVNMDKESGRMCCEVFTLGHKSDESWRHLTFPDNVNLNWHKKGLRVIVVSSGGAVHYLLTVKVGDHATFEEIVSLDVESERFVVNCVPKCSLEGWKKVSALDWDGKLGFAYVNGENLEVIESKDYTKQRWCEKKKVVHLPFMKNNKKVALPVLAKGGDIWFWVEEDGSVFRYNVETERRTDVQAEGPVANKNYPYKPSLVSFEGMKPDTMYQTYRPRLF